ncbi:hypothetical protein FOA52_004518 [Chlamydomonas sp. UWO 241]|nr:hypothetical protein FOA52_004518 [Chlamydomonas sp. UWO 241]
MAPRHDTYTPLHYSILDFCARVGPTEDELRARNVVVEGIRQCARKALPDYHDVISVQVYGSHASGLSTWQSDVDIVITGMFEPERSTGCYDIRDRGRVTARLRRIADVLRAHKKLGVSRIAIIGRARIPIIKLRTRSNVSVDISFSDGTGVRAADYIATQASVHSAMRPLTLVLKAFLKSQRLNDVATGGLSSYSLCHMVIAHLLEEMKNGGEVEDLGETLYCLLLRYGEEFDYERDAVSVRMGGIVPKGTLPFAMDSARFAASMQSMSSMQSMRLSVDCPLTGRDVSNGTYRINQVRTAMYRGARQLEALARGRSIQDISINYLSALLDVDKGLKRVHTHDDPFVMVLDEEGGQDLLTSTGRRPQHASSRFEAPPPDLLEGLEMEEEDYELSVGGSEVDSDVEWVDGSRSESGRGASKGGRRR